MHFYNEIDQFACQWLKELIDSKNIPQGIVDERSIRDIQPTELEGHRQCHFFAGIGGWPYALRLAGWPEPVPVWTGSCPCQPFSSAGKRKGESDERHLWPEFFRLIRECKPPVVFGEQVASPDGLRWLDGVFADLEGAGYACGAADLCAAGIGAPHIRQRLYWVAYTSDSRQQKDEWRDGSDSSGDSFDGGLANSDNDRQQSGRPSTARDGHGNPIDSDGGVVGLGDSASEGCEGQSGGRLQSEQLTPSGFWGDSILIPCRDGKARRVGRSVQPLAYGVPTRRSDPRMGFLIAELGKLGHSAKDARRILRKARSNRNGRLRGYGNAIVPQVAAIFVRAFMEGCLGY